MKGPERLPDCTGWYRWGNSAEVEIGQGHVASWQVSSELPYLALLACKLGFLSRTLTLFPFISAVSVAFGSISCCFELRLCARHLHWAIWPSNRECTICFWSNNLEGPETHMQGANTRRFVKNVLRLHESGRHWERRDYLAESHGNVFIFEVGPES